MAQYKTVCVSRNDGNGWGLNHAVEAATERVGRDGWRVDSITRSDDGELADIHFIKD